MIGTDYVRGMICEAARPNKAIFRAMCNNIVNEIRVEGCNSRFTEKRDWTRVEQQIEMFFRGY